MTPELTQLVEQSHERIRQALAQSSNPLLAYSGGKDALVVALLMREHGVTTGVSEMSFYFQQQEADIISTAQRLGLDISWQYRFDDEWLRRHPQYLFSDDTKVRAQSFTRQQGTVRQYAKKHDHDLVVFGRRTEENTVRSHLYETQGYLSFHPVREWRETHVWEFLAHHQITKPWIYTTAYGELVSGNGPFYSLKASLAGGINEAWAIVSSLDPTITPERYKPAVS